MPAPTPAPEPPEPPVLFEFSMRVVGPHARKETLAKRALVKAAALNSGREKFVLEVRKRGRIWGRTK